MNAYHQAATGTDFLNIGQCSVEQVMFIGMRNKGERVRPVIDQSNGAVFQETARHPFCV